MALELPPNDKYSLARWKPIHIDDLIRLGRPEDGGYVISRRCVEETQVLFSLGISEDWSFEEAFIRENRRTTVIGIDGSVSATVFFSRAVKCIKSALLAVVGVQMGRVARECRVAAYWFKKSLQFRMFYNGRARRFHQLFVADMPKPGVIALSGLWGLEPRLATTLKDCPCSFIKIDIEGSEYRVLPGLAACESKINGLAVEFHDCDIYWDQFSTIMDQLSQNFVVVHIHGNNFESLIPDSTTPRALEISFLNRRLLSGQPRETTAQFPRPSLDRPCNPSKPDYPIYFCLKNLKRI
jgi:hypothetical protein